MELHVGELTSEVEIGGSASVLPPQQIEQIVRLVIERLDARERARRQRAEALAITPNLLPRHSWE